VLQAEAFKGKSFPA
jgi:hypothetical protein